MITINNTPPETIFAGNPVLYSINSDNQFLDIGRFCQFYLVISAAETAERMSLEFAFPDKTIIFMTANGHDDSGLQIQIASSSGSWATWAQVVYDALMTNYDISSRFQITLENAGTSNRVLSFIAHERGTAYSAIVTSNLRTATVFSYISGLNPGARSNFAIMAGIWDENNRRIVQDLKPVKEDGSVMFNFSEYLSAIIENNNQPRFTWPFDHSRLYQIFNNYILPFYAGFAEFYDGQVKKIHFDSLRFAMAGGLNRETMVAYNSSSLDFFSVAENLLRFMTWAPMLKMTNKTSPELLFYYIIAKAPYDQLDFVVIVIFTDGSTDSIITDMRELPSNGVIELSVGYEHLDFENVFPTKTVSKWFVKLASQDLHMETETRTFILDNQTYENERIFIFQNSWGRAYDVVRFTGKGSKDIEVGFSTASSETIGNYTSFNAPVSKFGASEIQRMKCNSGWISYEKKDYLREMLLSKQVFEYVAGNLYPIIITNDKISQYFRDDEYLFNIEIDYDRAYRDFFFLSSL